jgi:hypothetical protein
MVGEINRPRMGRSSVDLAKERKGETRVASSESDK